MSALQAGTHSERLKPDSVVVFRKGSLFSLQANVTPSFAGRTYANFELNVPEHEVMATGSSVLQ